MQDTGKTVVVADDDANFLAVMAQRCQSLGLRVQTAQDGIGAITKIVGNDPDLLILDVDMPTGDGLGIAERLLLDPRIKPTPVVFCTGRSDAQTLARCNTLGAHYVTKGANTWADLKPIICRLLALQERLVSIPVAPATPATVRVAPVPEPERPKVLFVDDDADLRRVMQIRLRACGVEVLAAESAMQALWIAMKQTPSVVISDYRMPKGSGEYLLARLRAVPLLRDIPVILLTGAGGSGLTRDHALQRRFLGEYGAAAFLTKPVDFGALLETLARYIPVDAEVWRQAAKMRRQ